MLKILVVDDSQAEIRLMQNMLQQGGFYSVGISDSTKIEEAIEEERPNVILLDVVMPKRNGFQACRDLKSHESYAQIPVILVTSKTAPRRFESVSSGPKTRKLFWFSFSTSRRNLPSTMVS